jgi:hypothetical protein
LLIPSLQKTAFEFQLENDMEEILKFGSRLERLEMLSLEKRVSELDSKVKKIVGDPAMFLEVASLMWRMTEMLEVVCENILPGVQE